MADAPRCDSQRSVLRSHMQRTAFFRAKFLRKPGSVPTGFPQHPFFIISNARRVQARLFLHLQKNRPLVTGKLLFFCPILLFLR